jgi:hypothetical protein
MDELVEPALVILSREIAEIEDFARAVAACHTSTANRKMGEGAGDNSDTNPHGQQLKKKKKKNE